MTTAEAAAPPLIALTMGEPAGATAEFTAGAHRHLIDADRQLSAAPVFFAIDDPERLAASGAPVIEIDRPDDAYSAAPQGLPVLPLRLTRPAEPGRPSPEGAAAAARSLEQAVDLVLDGSVEAVVTNPIDKKALQDGVGFAFPGHTEYLAERGGVEHAVMMLASPLLRVVPATIHIALEEVPRALTPERLERVLQITARALETDFGVAAPRLALAGLNPHAGEGGAIGREERDWIAPLADRLRAEGMRLLGPLSADTMFHPAARARYDAAVCMYHDQALIPIKTLDFERGVNVTLGLPFVRTSPDHGVAYDIAGTGRADPTSLVEALRLADQLARRRRAGARGGAARS